MKTTPPIPSRLLFLATAGAGCLFAALALSGPNPPEQKDGAPGSDALALAAVRRQVVEALDAPALQAVEREKNRRLFSRVAIPESLNPPPAPPFHSIEIVTVSSGEQRPFGGEVPATRNRIPFRIHRVDPVARTSQTVTTGYYDTLTGQVYLLDHGKNANVPADEHPLLKGAVG